MKNFISEFLRRGFMAAGGGPLILAIIYYIIGKTGETEFFSYQEICTGIISITIMAFIAGGITAIYQNDKLPVATSALIHAGVLYLDYLFMYFLNDWIPRNSSAIVIFTVVFSAGFALVWLIIFMHIRKKTENINKLRSVKE